MLPGAIIPDMIEMFKERKDYLLKVLQVVWNFVTYGDKDTLPMEEVKMGADDDDCECLEQNMKKMKSMINKVPRKQNNFMNVGL